MNSILKGLIQLSPIWSLSLLAFIPLTAKVLNRNQEPPSAVSAGLYSLALSCSLVLFFFLGFNGEEFLFLRFDSYSSGAALLAGLAGLIALAAFYFNSWLDKKQLTEILFFFCQGLAGLYIFCLSQELMTAFIGLEALSLSLYINIAMSRKDSFCLEAAIKYFVLNALAGAVFLYGLSFLFGAAGSLELDKFLYEEALYYNRFFFLGFALVLAALLFKMAVFPFHFWLADVYQGALSPIMIFMAVGVKSALVLFLGKIFSLPFFEASARGGGLLEGLALAGILTVLFGNIMALRQEKLKRLAAFSSLAHSGYLILALTGLLNIESAEKDFSVIFYYLLAYILLTGGMILCFQFFEKESSQPELKDLSGLFAKNPFLALALSVFLLGLAGIPPSFGFFAKIGIFQPLILSGSWWALFWIIAGSAIGLYYYIKPLTLMLSKEEKGGSFLPPSSFAKFILCLLALAGLGGGWLLGFFFA